MHPNFLLTMSNNFFAGATRAMRRLSNVCSPFIPGQDVPSVCRFGKISHRENLEHLLRISSSSSLKVWDGMRSNLRLDALYDGKTEPVSLPPAELAWKGIQQAQQSSDDCQSKVSKQHGRPIDFSKCADTYKLKTSRGSLPSPAHLLTNWSSRARWYGSPTSLTMRGRGVFSMHNTKSPAWFGNISVRGFSEQSSNSSSPPSYWACGPIVMRRPSLDLPPPSLPYSRFHEPVGMFVDHCPYSLLDEEYINGNSFLLHFSPTEYYTRNPVMESVGILGDLEHKLYWKLRESTKYSFHEFLSTVSALHDLGVCLSEISEETVAVDSAGRFSFIKGKFLFVPCTVDGINKDFREIAQLFRRVTIISMGEEVARCIPNDYSLLLDVMETGGFEMRYLIITHSSLLPIGSKAAVYMNMYQTVKAKLTDTEIEDLFKPIPYGIGWFLSATRNTFLCECIMRNLHMMRRNKPLFYFSGSKLELFDTGRHLFAHRFEIWRRFGIWIQEVDLLWDILFGDLTAHIQRGFMKAPFISILRYMRIEDHFLDRKVTRPW